METVKARPIAAAERISEIDIVRGIALFGILMVNMSFFKYPLFFDRFPSNFAPGSDQAVAWVIQFFFTGKFYAIFSFLFGLGFFIFMERTLQKGLELVPLYRRRLFALLFLGAVHLFILWSGDILFTYALVGFILLSFREKSTGALKKWIIALAVVSAVLHFAFGLLSGMGEAMLGAKYSMMMGEMISEAIDIYVHATFFDLILFRLASEVPYVFLSLIVWIPSVLAFFLCGLYVGRVGLFKNIGAFMPLIKRVRNFGLPVGFLFMALYAAVGTGAVPVGLMARAALLQGLNYLASLFLFPAYVALVIIACQGKACSRILAPVAAAGRMALTNYLAQTLILITLFYGFGFALYGSVSATQGLFIVIALYLAQVAVSNAWFTRFRFGPMEWLWRSATYWERPPMLK